MGVNNCLFPVKLTALLNQAKKNIKWTGNRHRLGAMPKDGKVRVMLMTPEMRQAFNKHYEGEMTRFRIAYFTQNNLADDYEETKIEVYNTDGEKLLRSYSIQELDTEQAMAVQTELMYAYIEHLGGYINSL